MSSIRMVLSAIFVAIALVLVGSMTFLVLSVNAQVADANNQTSIFQADASFPIENGTWEFSVQLKAKGLGFYVGQEIRLAATGEYTPHNLSAPFPSDLTMGLQLINAAYWDARWQTWKHGWIEIPEDESGIFFTNDVKIRYDASGNHQFLVEVPSLNSSGIVTITMPSGISIDSAALVRSVMLAQNSLLVGLIAASIATLAFCTQMIQRAWTERTVKVDQKCTGPESPASGIWKGDERYRGP